MYRKKLSFASLFAILALLSGSAGVAPTASAQDTAPSPDSSPRMFIPLLSGGYQPAQSAQTKYPGNSPKHATSTTTDGRPAGPRSTASTRWVQLKGDPLATYTKTKPPQGKKIDFSSTTVKSYRALLSAQRNDFKAWLRQNAPKAKVTGEYDLSLNAVAIKLNGEKLRL